MPKNSVAKPRVPLSATQGDGEAYVDTSHMNLLLFVLVESKQDSESFLKMPAFYRLANARSQRQKCARSKKCLQLAAANNTDMIKTKSNVI